MQLLWYFALRQDRGLLHQDEDALLGDLVRRLKDDLRYPTVAIFREDVLGGFRCIASAGRHKIKLEEDPILRFTSDDGPEKGVFRHVLRTGEPYIAPTRQDPILRHVKQFPDTQCEMALPIKRHGTVVGVLAVESPRPRSITASDLAMLQIAVAPLGPLLDRLRTEEELYRLATQPAAERSMAATCQRLARWGTERLGASLVVVYGRDPTSGVLNGPHAAGVGSDLVPPPRMLYPARDSWLGIKVSALPKQAVQIEAVDTPDAITMTSDHTFDRAARDPLPVLVGSGLRARAVIRLDRTLASTECIGLIVAYSDRTDHFRRETDSALLQEYRRLAMVATEQALAHERDVLARRQELAGLMHESLRAKSVTIGTVARTIRARLDSLSGQALEERLDLVIDTSNAIDRSITYFTHAWDLAPPEQNETLRDMILQIVQSVELAWPTIDCDMVFIGDPSIIPSNTAESIRVMVDQAVVNACQHASPSIIRIYCAVSDDRVDLRVFDDGRGFTLRERRTGAPHGLPLMRERAARMGGSWDVRSASDPDEGCSGSEVLLQVPIHQVADPTVAEARKTPQEP